MRYRFAGETEVLDCHAKTWEEFWNVLEAGLDDSRGIEKITYSAPGFPDEQELDESTFRRFMQQRRRVSFDGDAQIDQNVVLTVYCAVRRRAQLAGTETQLVIYATSLEHFVQQIEEQTQMQIHRITMKGPTGADVEVDDDRFRTITDATLLTLHADAPGSKQLTLAFEGEKHFLQPDISWTDLNKEIQRLAPAKIIEKITMTRPSARGKHVETEVDEHWFRMTKDKAGLLLAVEFNPDSRATEFTVKFDDVKKYPQLTIYASSLDELVDQVEVDIGRHLDGFTYEIRGPHGQLLQNELDDFNFADVRELDKVVLHCKLSGPEPTMPMRRMLVVFPGEHFPINLNVTDYKDLVTQVEEMLATRDLKLSRITYVIINGGGKETEITVDEKSFADIAEPDTLFHVYTPESGPSQTESLASQKLFHLQFAGEDEHHCSVYANDFDQLRQRIVLVCSGRHLARLSYKKSGAETELTESSFPDLEALVDRVVVVHCDPLEEGQGIQLSVKFPFESKPRVVAAETFDAILDLIDQQTPHGFSNFEKLTFKDGKKEIVVDEAVLEDIEDPQTVFQAHFVRDSVTKAPSRTVYIEDDEHPHYVKALLYQDLVDEANALADGEGQELEEIKYRVAADGSEQSLTEKNFFDLPLSTPFVLRFKEPPAKVELAQVRFNETMSPVQLPATTFGDLMEAISLESDKRGQEVENITYFVEGPGGRQLEFDDLDEDVFAGFEDLSAYTFRVHCKAKEKMTRIVKFPGEDDARKLKANTYAEFIAEVKKVLGDFQSITYDVPGPKGRMLTFELAEEAWADLDDLPDTVFTVFAQIDNQLPVLFPGASEPKRLPGATFADLVISILNELPIDTVIESLSYNVHGPKGRLIEVPLTEEAFGDIEDPETVIKVKTMKGPTLQLHFPVVPIRCPETYEEFVKDAKARCPPGKTIKAFNLRGADGSVQPMSAANYDQLTEDVRAIDIDVVYN